MVGLFSLTPKRQKKLQKLFSAIAIFSLFLQIGSGIFYFKPVLAEDVVEPTPTIEQPAETPQEQPPAETPVEATPTPENNPTPEAPSNLETTPTPTPIPTVAPTPIESLSIPQDGPPLDLGKPIEDPTSGQIAPTPAPIEKVCSTDDQPIIDTTNENWEINLEEGWAKTKEPVKLGVKYVYPQENKVTITFKCLPKDESLRTPLKIQKVKISDLKLPEGTNPYGEYAYDITTGMENGTFKYDITLPFPKELNENATVKYAENVDSLENIKEIEGEKDVGNDEITIKGLNHFTIFIIDDGDSGYSDNVWNVYNSGGCGNNDHRWVQPSQTGKMATWTLPVSALSGRYSVKVNWTTWTDHATNAHYQVYKGGALIYTSGDINQKLKADGSSASNGTCSGWYTLGSFDLSAGDYVKIGVEAGVTNGNLVADSVAFLLAPTIIYPANNSYKTTATQDKVDWTDSVGSYPPFTYKYESYKDVGYTLLAYSSGWLATSEIPTPGTPQGNYYLRVKAKDSLGNETDWSNGAGNPYKITVDNTVPIDPSSFTSNPAGNPPGVYPLRTNDNTILMDWPDVGQPGGASDNLSGVDGYSYSFTHNASDVPDTVKDLEEDQTSVISVALSDGYWYFHLRTVDNSGNWTSTVHFGPFAIDATVPNAAWFTPSFPAYTNGIVNIQIKNITDNSIAGSGHGVSGINNITIYVNGVKINDGVSCPEFYPFGINQSVSNGTFNCAWDTTGKPDGAYNLTDIRVTDFAGNTLQMAPKGPIYVDRTLPGAPTITFPSSEQYFNSSPILNQWTSVSDSSGIAYYRVQYEYDDHHTFSGYPYRIVLGTSRNHSPAITEQGGVSFRVQAFDNAGNEGAWSGWRHYYYDATPPVVSIDQPSDGAVLSGVVTILGSIVEDNLSHYNLALYPGSDHASTWNFSNRVWQKQGSLNNVSHSLDTTAFADGPYMLRLAARDKAGNRDPMVDSGTGVSVQVIDVVISNYGSISGIKYEDKDGDGSDIETGDNPLSGWKINIYRDGEQDKFDSDTTDTTGEYKFEDLVPGKYFVCEELQSGWRQTYPMGDFPERKENTKCYKVDLSAGQNLSEYNFGNFEYGYIQGRKYEDLSQDGTRQAGEPWLENWQINLYDGNWQFISPATTAANTGIYRFENLGIGTYYTCEVLKEGWQQTDPILGGNKVNNLSSNSGNEGSVCWRSIINQSAQSRRGRQFGNIQYGSISGMKFEDMDGDGFKDGGDNGLGGWTIQLKQGEMVINSINTATDGTYAFQNIIAGDYQVCEVEQDGWTRTQPSDSECQGATVTAGQDTPNVDFGNFKKIKISGYKFEDVNGNGIWDKDEPPLDDWMINLTGSASASVQTGAGEWIDGYYEFTNLGPGTYNVAEQLQTGWMQTTSPVNYPITAQSGSDVPDKKFGNFKLGQITACKYDDYDGDGAKDDNEPVMKGITMILNPGEGQIIGETDNNGCYTFSDLGPGIYRVAEVLTDSDLAGYFPTDGYMTDGNYRVSGEMIMTSNGNFTVDYFNDLNPVKLSLTKTHDMVGATASPGDTLNFTLTVSNTASSTAYGVTVNDVLPIEFSYVGGSGKVEGVAQNPTINVSQLTWSLGTITAGGSKKITYQAIIKSPLEDGGYPNMAVSFGTNRPSGPDNSTSYSNFAVIYTAVGSGTSYSASVGGGFVLGAATGPAGTVLGAATGSPTILLIMAILMILGGLLIYFKKGRKFHV